MKYGLPYKGSKNKLAERIVRLLPKRTHLVDLFCGGCAVSHAALLMGKYEHIHINDINWMCPTLFIDALNGKYNDENRWISREDFFRLKDTDPYVAVVWSFGNNLRDYLYSKEIEPLKKPYIMPCSSATIHWAKNSVTTSHSSTPYKTFRSDTLP